MLDFSTIFASILSNLFQVWYLILLVLIIFFFIIIIWQLAFDLLIRKFKEILEVELLSSFINFYILYYNIFIHHHTKSIYENLISS